MDTLRHSREELLLIHQYQKSVYLELRTSQRVLGKHYLSLYSNTSSRYRRIWLEDVAAELTAAGNTNLEFVGFDISSTNFPKHPKGPLKFVIQDIHKEFPEEYHNSFDVVHVRLLLVVLTIDQIKPAVDNLLKLLSEYPL